MKVKLKKNGSYWVNEFNANILCHKSLLKYFDIPKEVKKIDILIRRKKMKHSYKCERMFRGHDLHFRRCPKHIRVGERRIVSITHEAAHYIPAGIIYVAVEY